MQAQPHLVRGEVRADEGHPAAVQGEGHRHSALVAAHAQHTARDTGGVDLPRVRLHQRRCVKSITISSTLSTSRGGN